MIDILVRKMIPDCEDMHSPDVRGAYGIVCSTVGILLNIILFIIKMLAGVISGSVAIRADAFNNLSDAGSSLITLVGFKMADKKPDIEHPFGHGRVEYISGLAVSMAIIFMGLELAKTSIEKILHPQPVDTALLSMLILIVAISVKLYMAYYNFKYAGKIDSAAMKATGIDSLSDTVATSVVLVSMLITKVTGVNIDAYCGVLVSAFILYSGYQSAKDTLSPLLGEPPSVEFVKQIQDIVLSHDDIVGIHDLIVHDYGPGRTMISLHAEVPGDGDIFVLHDLIDQVENELKLQLKCDAVIHMDPIEVNNMIVNETKAHVYEIIKGIGEEISMHDFRMVVGPTHTNLVFDVAVPFGYKLSDDELLDRIQKAVSEWNSNYYTVVVVDKLLTHQEGE
ncbi:MAG: cation diffusion facilitator family transporter [Lachnospiraceae bacterium]